MPVLCQNLGLRSAGAADAVLILNGGIPVLTLGLAALLPLAAVEQAMVGPSLPSPAALIGLLYVDGGPHC